MIQNISILKYFFLIILICPIVSVSQENESLKTDKGIVNRFEKSMEDQIENEKIKSDYIPEIVDIVFQDEQAKKAMFTSLKSYYEYHTIGFNHRKEVFAWQLFSAKIIFFIVIFLVLVGIYFSWIQFHITMEEKKVDKNSESQKSDERTEIGISPKEIRVSSPVLGVIILVISLLFFYLYLIYVFPIEEIL